MLSFGLAGRLGVVRLAPVATHRQQCKCLFTGKPSSPTRPSLPHCSRLRKQKASEGSAEIYSGMYGQWSITQQDLIEVKDHKIRSSFSSF